MKKTFWIFGMYGVVGAALTFGVASNWNVRAAAVCVGWHFIDKYC